MMKHFLAILMLIVCLGGCVRYHNPNINQAQANYVVFECKYKAEQMSQSYKSLYSAVAYADFLEQCLQANGFVPQR